MNIWAELWFAFWFFLPAGISNMAPIFANHVPGLNQINFPMDFNLSVRGRRVLGPNKTWRGFIFGIILSVIAAVILSKFFPEYPANPYLLGFLLGAGALVGDALKSFFKRQMDIPSGQSWLIFDQVDYILGGILFTFWLVKLSWGTYVEILLLYFFLHLIISIIGNLVGLKEEAI